MARTCAVRCAAFAGLKILARVCRLRWPLHWLVECKFTSSRASALTPTARLKKSLSSCIKQQLGDAARLHQPDFFCSRAPGRYFRAVAMVAMSKRRGLTLGKSCSPVQEPEAVQKQCLWCWWLRQICAMWQSRTEFQSPRALTVCQGLALLTCLRHVVASDSSTGELGNVFPRSQQPKAQYQSPMQHCNAGGRRCVLETRGLCSANSAKLGYWACRNQWDRIAKIGLGTASFFVYSFLSWRPCFVCRLRVISSSSSFNVHIYIYISLLASISLCISLPLLLSFYSFSFFFPPLCFVFFLSPSVFVCSLSFSLPPTFPSLAVFLIRSPERSLWSGTFCGKALSRTRTAPSFADTWYSTS